MIRTGERGSGQFKEVSWEEALDYTAAALLQGMTAQYLLRRTYRVQPGDTLLFHAGGTVVESPRIPPSGVPDVGGGAPSNDFFGRIARPPQSNEMQPAKAHGTHPPEHVRASSRDARVDTNSGGHWKYT